jgi:hypothetical protein
LCGAATRSQRYPKTVLKSRMAGRVATQGNRPK